MEALILNSQLRQSYDHLQTGIILISQKRSILFFNQWIKEQLPESLKEVSHLDQLLDLRNASSILSKIHHALESQTLTALSMEPPQSLIPLSNASLAENEMAQQGILIPIKILDEATQKEEWGALLQIHDVSHMMQQIKELEQAVQQQKQSAMAKGFQSQFLSNMHHEVRTPLSSIVGFSQLILSHKECEVLPKDIFQYLKNIKRASTTLDELLNNMFDLSTIEPQTMPLLKEDLNLKLLLQGIYHINKPAASQKNLTYTYEIDTQLPERIHSDRRKLNQILMNLVTNAIQFTPEGKSVTLRALKEGTQIHFQVVDTGNGISPKDQATLLGLFNPTNTASQKNPKKGLEKTQEMVEMLSGTLTLESELHQGSAFSVRFPLEASVAKPQERLLNPPQGFRFCQNNPILVCEDNPMSQIVIQAIFDDLELECVLAEDGAIGLQKALELKDQGIIPSLILMDLHMPQKNGLETSQLLRQHSELENVPIVILSADAINPQQASFQELGISDYLAKPLDLEKILPLLQRYLKTEVLSPPNASDSRPPLPVSIQKQLLEEWKMLSEFPIYYVDEIIEHAEEMLALCENFDSPYPLLIQNLIATVYKGDETLYLNLIQEMKNIFKIAETFLGNETSFPTLPSADSNQLPELLHHLENEVQDQWQAVCEVLTIGNAETFSQQIEKLGEQYRSEALKSWGKRLSHQVESFDINTLVQTLEEFPEILIHFQSLHQKQTQGGSHV